MIGPGTAGTSFEAFAEGFATGLVGTLGVTIDDGDGSNIVPRTTAGIVEIQTVDGFGVYRYLGTYPSTLGTYLITWDDTDVTASEDLVVGDAFDPVGVPTVGPCEQWVTAEEVAECCGIEYGSDTEEALEAAAEAASSVLFALSVSLWRGTCGPVTVRPCGSGISCYVPGRSDRIRACGCAPLSEVLLPGYPVLEIGQVKLDGEVLAPGEYRLDDRRKLVRLADADGDAQRWPACQRMDLADTEERTFSVTYYYGIAPPALGVAAASQLGCELYRSCTNGGSECALPTGTTRITRQGITIERGVLASFLQPGQTGLASVDAFLVAHGAGGAKRRPAVWSPDGPRYAKQIGA
jgi:hypothetical protein